MSEYSEWSRAFQIFDKYEGNQYVAAEHDVVYAGPDPEIVSAEDIAELELLGWYPSSYDGFYTYV